MPTKAELQELATNNKREWTGLRDKLGMMFRPDSGLEVYVFLPAPLESYDHYPEYIVYLGYYWSSIRRYLEAWGIHFSFDGYGYSTYPRYVNYCVRGCIMPS